jgi:hypothetical protein
MVPNEQRIVGYSGKLGEPRVLKTGVDGNIPALEGHKGQNGSDHFCSFLLRPSQGRRRVLDMTT